MNSIRGRLLLYLIPALLVIYSLTAWRVLTVTAHEADEVFDAELAHHDGNGTGWGCRSPRALLNCMAGAYR